MTYPTREDRERLTHRRRDDIRIGLLFAVVIVACFIVAAFMWVAE